MCYNNIFFSTEKSVITTQNFEEDVTNFKPNFWFFNFCFQFYQNGLSLLTMWVMRSIVFKRLVFQHLLKVYDKVNEVIGGTFRKQKKYFKMACQIKKTNFYF